MKNILFSVFAFFIFNYAFAQSTNSVVELPKILPPSPAAQNFMRYGEIPVDYSTGVPNINVPLYMLKSRKLELPLSLSYHASGIKVQDVSSIVGLGWVLNAGGIITKTVLGFGISPNSTNSSPTYNSSASLESAIASAQNRGFDAYQQFGTFLKTEFETKKWQSDKYFYQLPNGQSGMFRYDYQTGALIKVPYAPVQINRSNSYSPNFDTGYQITDENGISYFFEAVANPNGLPTTCFNIRQILSADQTDTIRFVYKSINTYLTPSYSSTLDYGLEIFSGSHAIGNDGETTISDVPSYNYSNNTGTDNFFTNENLIDSIITATTVVTFTYKGDRREYVLQSGKYRLEQLKIFDRISGTLIRQIFFDNHQSDFGDGRLKLDALMVQSANAKTYERYTFDYNTSLPAYPRSQNGPFSEDYWGYNNGTSGTSLLPKQFVPRQFTVNTSWGGTLTREIPDIVSTIRSCNSLASAALLTAIHYPTGGKTVFTYESNQAINAYESTNVASPVGGLRILKIENFDKDNLTAPPVSVKTYNYSSGITRRIQASLYAYGQRYFYTGPVSKGGSFRSAQYRTVMASAPMLPLTADNGPPVFYERVTEQQTDQATGNISKIEYQYKTPGPVYSTNAVGENARFNSGQDNEYGNYVPLLVKKTAYNFVSNNFTPVQQTENSYTPFHQEYFSTGTRFTQQSSYPNGVNTYLSDYNIPAPNNFAEYWPSNYPDFIGFSDMQASQQINLLTQSKVTNFYDNNLPVTVTTEYTYSASLNHLQPIKKSVSNSKGDVSITTFTYPEDFSDQAPYNTMYNTLHVWSPVIEQAEYKNSLSNFVRGTKTNYSFFNGKFLQCYPQNLQTRVGNASYDTRINYLSYDDKYGNLTEVSKTGGAPTAYQWGFKGSYPVVQAVNTPVKNIYVETFEEGNGNDANAHSGHFSFTGNFNKTVSNLSMDGTVSGGSFILSYWKSENNKWNYYQNTLTASGNQINIQLNGTIDDIRLHPVNAQITSFTYDPLIGITSITDTKNVVSYFTYDEFNRLTNELDQNKNILKQYDYNYRGQTAGINSGIFYSARQERNYPKNDCGEGYLPGYATYIVEQGKYTSTISQDDADRQAISEADNQAQSYANLNGSCTPKYGNDLRSGAFRKNDCSGGTEGSLMFYYVAPNTFRATTLDAANALADADINANGQAFVNSHAGCATNVIYAKCSTVNTYTTMTGSTYNMFGDVIVNFYSDQACTVPVSVNALTINLMLSSYNNTTNQTTSNTITMNVSGQSALLYPNVMIFGMSGNDFIENYWLIQDGTGYIPLAN